MANIDKMLGTETAVYLFPGYGRAYPDNLAMLRDWEAGKDFRIAGGPYCSIRDLETLKKEYDRVFLLNPSSGIIPPNHSQTVEV